MASLHLKAKPNARQNALHVAADGTVTVRLKARPQDGKANACLLAYLAEVFAVAKSQVALVSGQITPFKKVEIAGISQETLQTILAQQPT